MSIITQESNPIMGLLGELVDKGIEKLAPSSIIKPETVTYTNEHVRIIDLTQSLFYLGYEYKDNGNEKGEISYLQLMENIKQLIKRKITEVGISTLVIVFDKAGLVPKEKQATQIKRKEASAKSGIKPYPIGTQLIAKQGIVTTNGSTDRVINISSLATSSHLRIQLATIIQNEILSTIKFSDTTSIIFDYDITGPYWYYPNGTHIHRTDLANTIGEADLLLGYYTRMFMKTNPIIIDQTDSDIIPIILNVLLRGSSNHPILWYKKNHHKTSKKGDTCINLLELYNVLYLSKPGNERLVRYRPDIDIGVQNVEMFIILCIVCGTDFVEKDLLTYYFNWEKARIAILDCWGNLSKLSSLTDNEGIELWTMFQTMLLQNEINNKTKTIPTHNNLTMSYASALNQLPLLSMTRCTPKGGINKDWEAIHTKIKFNWGYWILPPAPEEEKKEEEEEEEEDEKKEEEEEEDEKKEDVRKRRRVEEGEEKEDVKRQREWIDIEEDEKEEEEDVRIRKRYRDDDDDDEIEDYEEDNNNGKRGKY